MAENSFYLRPSADVLFEHSYVVIGGSGYYSGGESGQYESYIGKFYSLLSEEVADDSATGIKEEAGTNENSDKIVDKIKTVTSQFRMSGVIPNDVKKVTGIVANRRSQMSGSTGEVEGGTFTVTANGISVSQTLIKPGGTLEYADCSSTITDDSLLQSINDYIKSNGGKFPEITLAITDQFDCSNTGNKTPGGLSTSQLYIQVLYENSLGTGICRKVNGAWIQATAAYRKVNGAWEEITADECRTLMSNKLICK